VAAGDELPEPFAGDLVNAAGDAFTQALQLAASLSAAVVVAAAVLAWTLLRRVGTGPEPEEARGLEVEVPVPDRTPCWQTRSGIAEAADEAGG
jgi:hypothetical protein